MYFIMVVKNSIILFLCTISNKNRNTCNIHFVKQSEEEQEEQMDPLSDKKRYSRGIDNVEHGENEKLITCRICYDDEKNETTVSPCNCVGSHAHVHVSCLEQWLSVSKSSMCDICNYPFKTVKRSLTIFEWLQEKRNCQGFFGQFMVMFFFISIWCFVLIACGMKTYEYFSNTKDRNSFYNGLLMCIITFAMAAMLWFWLIIFSSIWKRRNMVIRLDKNYLNGANDINNAFSV
ncbi:hypothetical protein AGLY_012219 [Aphis glycines]|uniref:Uncharacterized protein n=1 Tax=Aphis glycines TaxID=307491 RepID=A0A6G0TBN1_APHGL|nr:hypothetical protein AGLY_012219 [Aphis glycines]